MIGKAPNGIHNVLLGADEIGSGCVHSAIGCYFAGDTALGMRVESGADVPGMGPVSMVDVPVRSGASNARASRAITEEMVREIEVAQLAGKHCLIHGLHGWALIPADMMHRAVGFPTGFGTIFRQTEWPKAFLD